MAEGGDSKDRRGVTHAALGQPGLRGTRGRGRPQPVGLPRQGPAELAGNRNPRGAQGLADRAGGRAPRLSPRPHPGPAASWAVRGSHPRCGPVCGVGATRALSSAGDGERGEGSLPLAPPTREQPGVRAGDVELPRWPEACAEPRNRRPPRARPASRAPGEEVALASLALRPGLAPLPGATSTPSSTLVHSPAPTGLQPCVRLLHAGQRVRAGAGPVSEPLGRPSPPPRLGARPWSGRRSAPLLKVPEPAPPLRAGPLGTWPL